MGAKIPKRGMDHKGGLGYMKKSEIQQKRNEILRKIDALQSKCNCFSAEESSNCSNCKEIAEHGQMLIHLGNKKLTASARPKDRKSAVTLVITKSQYHEYKKQKKKDKEIAKICNVSTSTLSKWKRKNNIAR